MRRRLAPLLALLCAAAPLRVPRAQTVADPSSWNPSRPRPPLPDGADTNSWEPYFDRGVEYSHGDWTRAEPYFIWASHLDPTRAEPLYAMWVSYWQHDVPRFGRWLAGYDSVVRAPEVMRVDSLSQRALYRNPFVHRGQFMALLDQMPGDWADDITTHAWVHYANAELPLALEEFGGVIDRDPKKFGYLRFVRASAFVNSGMTDSALVDLQKLLAQERANDQTVVGSFYESKELLLYAIGLIHSNASRRQAAVDAFGEALVENAAFTPARRMLALYALATRDVDGALLQYDAAVGIDSNDVMLRDGYGDALLAAHRPADAVTQYRAAVALEPLYAKPYFGLGRALEESGDAQGAMAAYTRYLARAPRGADDVATARAHLTKLSSGG